MSAVIDAALLPVVIAGVAYLHVRHDRESMGLMLFCVGVPLFFYGLRMIWRAL